MAEKFFVCLIVHRRMVKQASKVMGRPRQEYTNTRPSMLFRLCLLIAGLQCFVGMGVVWGATTGYLQLTYPALLVAGFVFSNSNAAIDIVSVATNLKNWPNDRGSAVGVMKAAVGLSSSIYGILYGALKLDTGQFMLVMMLLPSLSCMFLAPLVNAVPWIQKSELMPHGLLTTPSRFHMSYQVSSSFMMAWRKAKTCSGLLPN
jgi:hypothetical protein